MYKTQWLIKQSLFKYAMLSLLASFFCFSLYPLEQKYGKIHSHNLTGSDYLSDDDDCDDFYDGD